MAFQAGKDQEKDINSTEGEDYHIYKNELKKGIDETSVNGHWTDHEAVDWLAVGVLLIPSSVGLNSD